MNPYLFPPLKASTAVKDLLGYDPLRVYPWGRAPENVVKPYAVYGVYNANPENYLGTKPDIDNKGTQIDLYGETAASVNDVFVAVRDVLEVDNYMTSFSTPDLDEDTNLYHARMEFDFWDER